MISWFNEISFPILFLAGIMILFSLFLSYASGKLGLPNVVGYMIAGVLLGPAVLNLLDNKILGNLEFITHMALGFVAFKIGLEIDLKEMKAYGRRIMLTVFSESFLAVFLVAGFIYLLTSNLALSLILGALAPASAPAGTIAVIDETKSQGKLTKTLFSVVGIDDGLAIIIFGIMSPVAVFLLSNSGNGIAINESFANSLLAPFREIVLSVLTGGLMAFLFIGLNYIKKLRNNPLPLMFGTVVLVLGISDLLNLSEILTCMIFGLVVGENKHSQKLKDLEEEEIGFILPLFYLLFFTIAGANLHIKSLPDVGLIGLLYIFGRVTGKAIGAFLGSRIAGFETNIQKYLGFGILSQAGVAIGLALIVKNQFQGVGPEINETGMTMGDQIGNIVFTTITATSVFFEIIGPITTKYALRKSGEINE